MDQSTDVALRRSTADDVFDHLYREIVTLRLMPGARMSEVEVATRFGISRQPVRDAFSRLGNLGFLDIRPQKATRVARFSGKAIDAARFVRLALEVEVTRRCHQRWSAAWHAAFSQNLTLQRQAMAAHDKLRFLDHDFMFHSMLCEAADVPFVVDTLREKKVQVDRLCLLSLQASTAIGMLVDDHETIIARMEEDTAEPAVAAMLAHLHRLDQTIDAVKASHGEYFET